MILFAFTSCPAFVYVSIGSKCYLMMKVRARVSEHLQETIGAFCYFECAFKINDVRLLGDFDYKSEFCFFWNSFQLTSKIMGFNSKH